jgi:hypothetical protein
MMLGKLSLCVSSRASRLYRTVTEKLCTSGGNNRNYYTNNRNTFKTRSVSSHSKMHNITKSCNAYFPRSNICISSSINNLFTVSNNYSSSSSSNSSNINSNIWYLKTSYRNGGLLDVTNKPLNYSSSITLVLIVFVPVHKIMSFLFPMALFFSLRVPGILMNYPL